MYHVVREGEGDHKTTMNDHEGEGSRNDHVVRWTNKILYHVFCVRSEKGCKNSSFDKFLEKLCTYT